MMKRYVIGIGLVFVYISVFAQRFDFDKEYNREAVLNDTHGCEEECCLLKKEQFIAISLGENCFPALHLRECGLRIRSFPFDWNITPFHALYLILFNDFKHFMDLQYLMINQTENTVFNRRYQFKLNHDFEITDWLDGSSGLVPRDEFGMNKYERVFSYYHRRIARFYKVFNMGVPLYLFRRVITAEQARSLNSLLRTKFPQSLFTLVCIQDEKLESKAVWKNMPSNIVLYQFAHPIDYELGKKNEHVVKMLQSLGLI